MSRTRLLSHKLTVGQGTSERRRRLDVGGIVLVASEQTDGRLSIIVLSIGQTPLPIKGDRKVNCPDRYQQTGCSVVLVLLVVLWLQGQRSLFPSRLRCRESRGGWRGALSYSNGVRTVRTAALWSAKHQQLMLTSVRF